MLCVESKQEDMEISYENYYQKRKMMWGVRSGFSPIGVVEIGGINDAELIYDESDRKYYLSIESIYLFEDDEKEFDYFNNIRERLLEWSEQNNITLSECEYKEHQNDWNFDGNSVEDVVSQFVCYFNDYFRLD